MVSASVPPCLRGSTDACSQQKFLNNSSWALRGRNDDFSVGSLKKYNGTVTALQRHGGVIADKQDKWGILMKAIAKNGIAAGVSQDLNDDAVPRCGRERRVGRDEWGCH